MTLASPPRTAARTVEAFFDAYRRQQVDEMVELCTANADFSYVPVEIWGRQRVVRGDGKVATIGKTLWTGLIASFPDLTNTVHTVRANTSGDVVVEVTIGGTQASAWVNMAARGGSFAEPHLFVFHVGEDGLIDSITAYWNNASISRQLGHLEVD
ncbi:nuclear transport factor 2 family protein [Pseudonocardia sp. H11422]|uniref:nuclear transport factor 2 family protein n=1 Tax=Pseudonocardia sp. H11422 TaxID=2835866 RepID=UPI001BDCE12C|nr:nuclear transport factor 2 family protein [Pseudonocardia sp. H11422]